MLKVAPDPAEIVAGVARSAMTGRVFSAATEIGDVVPPPGVGLNTVTCCWPGVVDRFTGRAAVSEPALLNVVARLVPFQRTTDEFENPEPVMANENGGDVT
jgi:hypothetical protein